jgi:hypothetical protein
LVSHLATSYISLRSLDFRSLQDYNPDQADQTHIPPNKQYAMLACLFHYDLDTSLLMRYLGNNYTGAHRDISAIVSVLRSHKIDSILIDKYVRVMLTGCPTALSQKLPEKTLFCTGGYGTTRRLITNSHRSAHP